MGVGSGTPCCACQFGLCADGEAIWEDDFQSYQVGQDLRSFGYLQYSGAIGDSRWLPIAWSDSAGGVCLRSGGYGGQPGGTNRLAPLDFQRFTTFRFTADIVSWFGQQPYMIGFGAQASVNETPVALSNYFFKLQINPDFGGSVWLEVGGNRTIYPPPPGHPIQSLGLQLNIANVVAFPWDPAAVYISGELRGFDNGGGVFDETKSFELARITTTRACGSQYGICGPTSTTIDSNMLRSDNWSYLAT